MIRTTTTITSRRLDLLVVGGGIHGLFAAYDAAGRGLSVALIERADFGSGLSFNHQRTLHGGLRALQSGNLAKTRQQIHERRTWARIAPHLIRPLPFLMGTHGWTTRSRWGVKAAFGVYDWIGRSRNAGVTPELHLPRARLESAAATRRLFQGVVERGLSGGAIWYDYQTHHPDRLTWTVALAAERAGAALVNYVSFLRPSKDGSGHVNGAEVRDELTGEPLTMEASVILVAAGAGLAGILDACGLGGAPPLVRAMNVLLNRPARDIAVVAPSRSGRMLTAVPWRGGILVGTDQSSASVTPPEPTAPVAAVDGFLTDINSAFPALDVRPHDIRLVHHGLTPGLMRGGRLDLMPEPRILRHSGEGVRGLISLVGVKYTTARLAAARAIDAVIGELGRSVQPSRTDARPLPFAEIADVEGRLVETTLTLGITLDRDVLEHLQQWYGTEASAVLQFSAGAGLMERLAPNAPVLAGEIAYAVDHAQAVRLSDAVLRRTPLGSAGHPGRDALHRAAEIMASRLGWSDVRLAEEIALVEARYPPARAAIFEGSLTTD